MNEELIREALRIIRKRAESWSAEIDKNPSDNSAKGWLLAGYQCAYTSAADMLEAALSGDAEVLAQFDY